MAHHPLVVSINIHAIRKQSALHGVSGFAMMALFRKPKKEASMQSNAELAIQKEILSLKHQQKIGLLSPYERILIPLKVRFLEAILKDDAQLKMQTAKDITHYNETIFRQSLFQTQQKQSFLLFFIRYGIFNHYKNTPLCMGTEPKNTIDYISHTTDCYMENSLAHKILPITILAVLTAPVLTLSCILSGYADSETRKPLDLHMQQELFICLGGITKDSDKKTVMENIIRIYEKRSGLNPKSTASKELIASLKSQNFPINIKWEFLLFYVTSLDKNNGKALFLIIHEQARNFRQDKLGFAGFMYFFHSENKAVENRDILPVIYKHYETLIQDENERYGTIYAHKYQ